MQEINAKFKDAHPEQTVEKIRSILTNLGIELEESWNDSGLEECWSVNVFAKDIFPFFSNGKGITKALARASAYGEFIERLQCGLFLYKFQSVNRDRQMNLQNFAPDGKYMTMQELEENGEWMDYIIQSYGHGLTRKKLAAQCKVYACTDEDKIWTVPFYSLFEDKYVYLPAGFVEHIYSANGCCAGNSPREAWIHALSEMMERNCTIRMLSSGKAAPKIPDEVIGQFPTASKIIRSIRDSGRYDVQLFDFSFGSGFPVVGTRIIDKHTHRYNVNICADPILEIAIDRTLTELFQGKNIHDFVIQHNGNFLEETASISKAHNVLNQLETGNGMFALDFFAEEIACDSQCSQFIDLHSKTNSELLAYMLGLYKDLGKPLYVRNYSFLGFNSYKLIVPGFSESRALRLIEPVCEYALGDMVYKVFRDAASASTADLAILLSYHNKISTAFSRRTNFRGLAGLPLDNSNNYLLTYVTLSYAAYRLGRLSEAKNYLEALLKNKQLPEAAASYFSCVCRYLSLKLVKASDEKIHLVLQKLYKGEDVQLLYSALESGQTPYDAYLMKCDSIHCDGCQYKEHCSYARTKQIIGKVGEVYSNFTHGQDKENFHIL